MLNSEIRKYDFIDALRGMAILGVIVVHSSQSVTPSGALLSWFMAEGARGVQLFYVASALTLCMSWVARSTHENSPIRNFYIRRFFRIAPMFYIAIVTYMLVNGFSPTYWAPNGIEWWFIPITAVFLHGFHPETITSVVPGGWSIAVEMSFYALLPFLFPHIKSKKACFFILILSLVISGLSYLLIPHIFSYPANQQYLIKSFAYLNFFGQLPVFIMGILGFLIFREKYPRKQIALVGGSAFIVLFLAFLYPVFNLPSVRLLNSLHHFIAGGLFVSFALLLGNWPVRFLVNKLTTTIGKFSFSMYLTHFAVLICFSRMGFSEIFPKSNLASILHFICVAFAATCVSFFFTSTLKNPA